MINFFRKIRKQLADDNQFFKYSRYAIGEILLVVIGILIALQINNWNENRKLKQFEYKILKDIETSMEGNFFQLNMCLRANKKAIISADIILKHLDDNLPYNDSLDFHFSRALEWCSPVFNNAGYESLKTYGTNLVTNDTIREALGIYDAGWMETLTQRQEEYFFNTASPVLTELFEIVAMRAQMKPFDYKQLRNSNKFISILKTSKENRKEQIRWYEKWQQSFESLDKMIKTELQNNNESLSTNISP